MKNTMIKATNINGELVYAPIMTSSINAMLEMIQENGCVVHKTFEVGDMPLNELPEDIQVKVKDILKVFPRCTVTYEYGKFTASASSCIKASYHYDHFVCGTYTDKEVYTIEERRQNYREAFGENPCF